MTALVRSTGARALSTSQFKVIAGLARREAGLVLVEAKAAMIASRLAKRLRARNLADFESYCTFVQSGAGQDELPHMISALTTNVSHFFREPHHFDMLRDKVLPPLLERRDPDAPIRLWSAGCSNGQELYSMAMTVALLSPDAASQGVRILGTDIDIDVLDHARRGVYDGAQISGITPDRLARFFHRRETPHGPAFEVCQTLRDLVRVNHLNLVRSWPIRAKFDVIFCRNVMIYFDEALQSRLWQRFADALRPGGWLFIGHSERIARDSNPKLRSCGLTVYQKAETPDQVSSVGPDSGK